LICLQKQVRTTTLIIDLNIVNDKNVKLKEKAGSWVSLLYFRFHFLSILRLYSYLSDNQQKEKR